MNKNKLTLKGLKEFIIFLWKNDKSSVFGAIISTIIILSSAYDSDMLFLCFGLCLLTINFQTLSITFQQERDRQIKEMVDLLFEGINIQSNRIDNMQDKISEIINSVNNLHIYNNLNKKGNDLNE